MPKYEASPKPEYNSPTVPEYNKPSKLKYSPPSQPPKPAYSPPSKPKYSPSSQPEYNAPPQPKPKYKPPPNQNDYPAATTTAAAAASYQQPPALYLSPGHTHVPPGLCYCTLYREMTTSQPDLQPSLDQPVNPVYSPPPESNYKAYSAPTAYGKPGKNVFFIK